MVYKHSIDPYLVGHRSFNITPVTNDTIGNDTIGSTKHEAYKDCICGEVNRGIESQYRVDVPSENKIVCKE